MEAAGKSKYYVGKHPRSRKVPVVALKLNRSRAGNKAKIIKVGLRTPSRHLLRQQMLIYTFYFNNLERVMVFFLLELQE
jgi:hypothetical protein